MVVIVFRSRIQAGTEKQLMQAGMRMYQLASSMPGFVSYKNFAAADGETVAIVQFETLEDSARWREHAEHRVVQERGRGELFSEFSVQVCELVRESRYP